MMKKKKEFSSLKNYKDWGMRYINYESSSKLSDVSSCDNFRYLEIQLNFCEMKITGK